MRPLVNFLSSSIGRKYLVAITGLLLMLFVAGHLAGNLQFFLPPEWINAYGHKLQTLGPLLWVIRLGLLAIVGIHIAATVSLVIENRKARPSRYAVAGYRASTSASRTMAVSGMILLSFIIFHLLHFTVRVIPGHEYNKVVVAANGTEIPHEIHDFTKHWGVPLADEEPHTVHNVHGMMAAGFSYWYISIFYVIGMFLLCMHLSHGAASFVQSLGLRGDQMKSWLGIGSKVFAWALFVGYVSLPLSVLIFQHGLPSTK
jgi:succinate dehydrogenase / fumarate reductase cytochrome b subunit